MKVVKADKDDQFYCEVTYFVPAGTRMTETKRINITVYCKCHTQSNLETKTKSFFPEWGELSKKWRQLPHMDHCDDTLLHPYVIVNHQTMWINMLL